MTIKKQNPKNMEKGKMRIFEQLKSVPEEMTNEFTRDDKVFTSVKPIWRIQKLTEMFGPCGLGWIVNIGRWETKEFNSGAVSITVEVELQYRENAESEWRKPIKGIGTSWAVYISRKGNLIQDDEAWKKAYTDAIAVATKFLGFAADFYILSDDNKYVEKKAVRTVEAKKETTETNTQQTADNGKAETDAGKQAEGKPQPEKEEKKDCVRAEASADTANAYPELVPGGAMWNQYVIWTAKRNKWTTNKSIRETIETKRRISDENFGRLLKEAGRA